MGNKSKKSNKCKKSFSPRSIDASSNSEGTHIEEKKSKKAANDESVKPTSSKAKEMRTLEDLMEAMKPSTQELEFRKKKSKKSDSLLADYTKLFKCTNCNKNFKMSSDKNGELREHPCLGVLMCKDCCDYYNDGEFSLDSDSEDKYCRWCGEGGTLFGCSKCICGFCTTCIKKHFGNDYLKKVEKDDDWLCFFCDPKPLWNKRYICFLAMQMSQNEISTLTSSKKQGLEDNSKMIDSKQVKETKTNHEQDASDSSSSAMDMAEWSYRSFRNANEDNSRKRFHYTSSDESESVCSERKTKRVKILDQQTNGKSQNESFENLKQAVLEKLEKAVKSSEYQLAFGMKWSSKMLKKLADPKHIRTPEDVREECQKVKWFLSTLSANLIDFCSSIDSAENSLPKEDGPNNSTNPSQPSTGSTDFSTVLKFLSFITNQVNTFMKKGFSLADVLEAEIYDNTEFIGIKKHSKPSSGASSESSCNVSSQTSEKSSQENHVDARPNSVTKLDKDESPDEDSMKLVVDQGSEVQEGDNECADGSGGARKDEKKDILQILQILEHA